MQAVHLPHDEVIAVEINGLGHGVETHKFIKVEIGDRSLSIACSRDQLGGQRIDPSPQALQNAMLGGIGQNRKILDPIENIITLARNILKQGGLLENLILAGTALQIHQALHQHPPPFRRGYGAVHRFGSLIHHPPH